MTSGNQSPELASQSGYPPTPVIHLIIRFILELVMFAGCGMAGYSIFDWPGAIVGAIASMVLWGVFGTRGDGSRGEPVVETPGPARLMLELGLFAVAGFGIWSEWSRAAAETFLTVSILHYAITWERQRWLIMGSRSGPPHEST